MGSEELKERGHWSGRLDFVLSLIGFSVGLGNIWRFPYLCFKNGGGAFLIPYFICLAVAGIPLLILEIGLGQYMSQGGITCWNLVPGWKGNGIAGIIIVSWLNDYLNVIMAWDLYYMGLSFAKKLPWSHCNNDFNTDNCLDPAWVYTDNNATQPFLCDGIKESENTTTKVLKQVCLNGTLANLSDFTPAVVEFWERKILQQHLSSGIEDMGGINWELAVSLIVMWIVVYFIICKGVKILGKVVYFTAPFPYVLLTILLVRALTLGNAFEGLNFYLNPDLSKLVEGQVWLDAATQIFFSYSIGLGTMMALGSYNKYNDNFIRDGMIFTLINSGTSLFGGLVIFSVLGFMAGQQGVPVSEVAKPGPGLAFIAYPEAVAQMPIPQLWAVLFFFMILSLGIDSEFFGVEGVITAVVDTWPHVFRKGYRREMFAAFYCFVSCCVGLTMTFYGGIYIFQLFDFYSASGSALLWIAAFESTAIAWFYSGNRFLDSFNEMLKLREGCYGCLWKILELYFSACWYVLTPSFCACVFVFTLVGYSHPTYQDYVYPWWGYIIGWFLALSSMVTIPLYFLYAFIAAEGNLSDAKERHILFLIRHPWFARPVRYHLRYRGRQPIVADELDRLINPGFIPFLQRWRAIMTPRLPNRNIEGEVVEDEPYPYKESDDQL